MIIFYKSLQDLHRAIFSFSFQFCSKHLERYRYIFAKYSLSLQVLHLQRKQIQNVFLVSIYLFKIILEILILELLYKFMKTR